MLYQTHIQNHGEKNIEMTNEMFDRVSLTYVFMMSSYSRKKCVQENKHSL